MAKSPVVKSDGVDKDLLKQIVAGTVTYVSQTQGQPMLAHVPALIEINPAITNPADPTQVACRATADAAAYLAEPVTAAHTAEAPKYEVLTGVELPAAKRRGNHSGSGAPTKYPFDSLPVGGVFFSGNSEHKKGDAVKALGSTVSAQNNKYSEPVMVNGVAETKTVTRAVRDKKTHKAVLKADGTKETETVQLPVKNYTRKFTIRPVEAGFVSGGWTAPEAGALIGRTK
jgi:hypothetical protein